MAPNQRWGPCTWEAICRICAENRAPLFTRKQIDEQRFAIRNCAKGHGENPEVTVSFQLTELCKQGVILADRGEYHLTDWGKANFRVFQKVETAKRSGQPPSDKEIRELYDEEWQEELKRWWRQFLRVSHR